MENVNDIHICLETRKLKVSPHAGKVARPR